MKIDIQARGFSLTDSITSHVRHQIRAALGRRAKDVQRVTVRLSDVNGPRGGQDKCCQVQVELANAPYVVIRDIRTNLYSAVSLAAERCKRVVARQIARKKPVLGRRPMAVPA